MSLLLRAPRDAPAPPSSPARSPRPPATEAAIVHFVEAFGGGVFETLRALASYSAANGVPTTVVHGVRPETPPDPAPLFHPDVRLVRVEGWGDRRPGSAARSGVNALRVLRSELAKYAGGVLHVHSSFAGVEGRLLPLRKSWALYYTPHGYGFLNPLYSARFRAGIAGVEAIFGRHGRTIAVSRAEADAAARVVGAARVAFVHLGVPLVDPVPPPAGDRLTVTAVGRVADTRLPEQFAQVARELHDLGLEFVWVGDGPRRPELESAGVRVTGWQPQDEARRAFDRAHVVLHLSALEGLPRALLEAMAAQRPIVASDIAPVREAVGRSALLVRDVAEAAAAVRRLALDARERAELGRAARARVERLFDVREMARRWMAAYGLANGGGTNGNGRA